VLEGKFGVAENGAVWIADENLPQRILPYITKDLVLVIERESLVDNMHDAYSQIDNFNEGFGAFIAGPSKTADIEQALVIGAQGPMSMTVLLVS
jgi:L-lactate dehydrogenase complex protein LldG